MYYLEEATQQNKIQQCKIRTTNYTNCATKDVNSDACFQCIQGYYVRNKVCIFKPTGVIGCGLYFDSQTCLKCKDNKYLVGNVCRSIPEANLINKCLYYKDESTCSDCQKGYLLVGKECKAILISNCQLYENEKECKICNSQFFLTDLKTCIAG